ncbi:MAG: hypothetical protein WCG21_06055 [Eubacteriales bacterium]
MQIFYLPDSCTLILFFLLWPAFQVTAALLCLAMDNSHFSYKSFIYRSRKWEDEGKIYQKIFKIRSWKKYLPDGGALMKGGYAKRHLQTLSKEGLQRFLVESCRAELSHILAILPFWVFGLFAPPRVILFMFIYSMAMNLPCIITQRYNRPRIVRLLQDVERSEIGMYRSTPPT